MIATLAIFALLLGVLAYFFVVGRDRAHEPTVHRRVGDGVDRAELEQAEREVMEADGEDAVRDWGPGATKPRPPELL